MPCLFPPWGRRWQYDVKICIRRQPIGAACHAQGRRAGFWRDKPERAVKGVRRVVQEIAEAAAALTLLCDRERCLTQFRWSAWTIAAAKAGTDQLLVLHQLGNHGPAYDRRYPDAFRRFVPVCDTADLRRCSREQIVNALRQRAALHRRGAGLHHRLVAPGQQRPRTWQ